MIKKSNLSDIIKANPGIYDMDENAEANFNILALFIYFEKCKGEKSFYHPYFNLVESSTTILDWTENDLLLLKDEYMLGHAKSF